MKEMTANRLSYAIAAKPFRYIIIGGKSADLRFMEKTFFKAFQGKAICEGRFGNAPVHKVNNLGQDRDIVHYLHRATNIQRVIYISSELGHKDIQALMNVCAAKLIDLVIVPRESNFFQTRNHPDCFHDLPVFRPQEVRIVKTKYQVLKRLFDMVFSGLVIVFILSWMVPLLALLIKLESKGPVFFVQKRTGYLNRSFPCVKFRSMAVNSECNEKQATRSDSRLTRIGAFIRRNNIDEFPQFFNVLLGHMSIVGPRPHMLKHTRQYAKMIDAFMIRHSVKPGITGWAQVNGHRGPTETVEQMQRRVEHDLWYIDNWTFLLDLKCIFMTVINFLKGEENAF